MWNAVSYFESINGSLKLTKGKYLFCRVSGLNSMEDVLKSQAKKNAFLAVDDTDDGVTVQSGGGYFNRRSIVVYILHKYKLNDMQDRETKMSETRDIHKKLLARLIKDSRTAAGLMYLNKSRIPYHEVPGYFAAGTTGLYFIFTIEEPVELIHNESDYEPEP